MIFKNTITRERVEQLEEAENLDKDGYNKLIEDYAGIIAKPYTGYSYFDEAGNYLGDYADSTTMGLLKAAYVEVVDDGT